jgi:broad specificity phosphatase PhoE
MRLLITSCLLLWCLAGCTRVVAGAASDTATFVVVRHAEKADDGSRDPPLSAAGETRAKALAQRLAHSGLVAVYATPFRRTQQTAQIVATSAGLPVTTYSGDTAAADFAGSLRARYRQGTVLVVGHSNTVPGIVASLCSCRIAALGDDAYDGIYTIRIGPDGKAALDVGRQ